MASPKYAIGRGKIYLQDKFIGFMKPEELEFTAQGTGPHNFIQSSDEFSASFEMRDFEIDSKFLEAMGWPNKDYLPTFNFIFRTTITWKDKIKIGLSKFLKKKVW